MKKQILLSIVVATSFFLMACGNSDGQDTQAQTSVESTDNAETASESPASTEALEESEPDTEDIKTDTEDTESTGNTENTGDAGSDVLVAYFSYGENAEFPDGIDASSSASIQTWNDEITGNTGVVAHMIGENTNADMFSIQTVEKYPADYNETIDQGEEENNENARPELSTHVENMDQYNTIFLGFPTWWYDMPMAMYSFLDEYDLSGKKVIMFCTSGGSGFVDAIEQTQEAEPEAEVIEGISIGADSATGAESQVTEWLQGLDY